MGGGKYANGYPSNQEAASFPATELKRRCSVPEPPFWVLPLRSCCWPRRPPSLRGGLYQCHRKHALGQAAHSYPAAELLLVRRFAKEMRPDLGRQDLQ